MSDAKKRHERDVFGQFAKAAELPVSSVENRDPQEPDIRCEIEGKPYRFELGRLLDEVIPESVVRSIRGDASGGFATSFEWPLVRMTRRKSSNTYTSDGESVDLVLYYDDEYAETADKPPPGPFKEWAEKFILPEIKNPGPFVRVWVFDRNDQKVLWSHTV